MHNRNVPRSDKEFETQLWKRRLVDENLTAAVSVHIYLLANNALRAHHASAHGGLSTKIYGLTDICLIFLNDSIELLEIMFNGTAFHSLAVVGEKTISECVGRLSNLKKLAVMFTGAMGIVSICLCL